MNIKKRRVNFQFCFFPIIDWGGNYLLVSFRFKFFRSFESLFFCLFFSDRDEEEVKRWAKRRWKNWQSSLRTFRPDNWRCCEVEQIPTGRQTAKEEAISKNQKKTKKTSRFFQSEQWEEGQAPFALTVMRKAVESTFATVERLGSSSATSTVHLEPKKKTRISETKPKKKKKKKKKPPYSKCVLWLSRINENLQRNTNRSWDVKRELIIW